MKEFDREQGQVFSDRWGLYCSYCSDRKYLEVTVGVKSCYINKAGLNCM